MKVLGDILKSNNGNAVLFAKDRFFVLAKDDKIVKVEKRVRFLSISE